VLEVTFVRRPGRRDRVYVSRDDGSRTGWDFPSYGDGLPHDLCHLVVEDELNVADGFWGLVAQGVEVGIVDKQATLMRDGAPFADQPGVELSGLRRAEAAVVAVNDGGGVPAGATREAAAAIRERLGQLAGQWRALGDGGAITIEFGRARA
jgi:hypothetical protein